MMLLLSKLILLRRSSCCEVFGFANPLENLGHFIMVVRVARLAQFISLEARRSLRASRLLAMGASLTTAVIAAAVMTVVIAGIRHAKHAHGLHVHQL